MPSIKLTISLILLACGFSVTAPEILATMTKMTLAEAEAKGLPLCSRCPVNSTTGKAAPSKNQ